MWTPFPGPFFRFVTVRRGKMTKAIFIDVRGATKEDVFIGLSMLVSLFFMLFVTAPIGFYFPPSFARLNLSIITGKAGLFRGLRLRWQETGTTCSSSTDLLEN